MSINANFKYNTKYDVSHAFYNIEKQLIKVYKKEIIWETPKCVARYNLRFNEYNVPGNIEIFEYDLNLLKHISADEEEVLDSLIDIEINKIFEMYK